MSETWTCERCGAPMVGGAIGGLCAACLMGGVLEQERDSAMFFDFDPDQPDASKTLERMLVGYEDFEPIGHGGMGVVYRARHAKLGRPVAIKVMRPRLADDPEFTDRFLRESRALAALSHPNIVTVYDFGEHAGMCFLVMELVEGASLRDMMRDGPLEPAHALAIVPQVCDALQYAHGRGVVHRDIKPENILVDTAGRVHLADFGLAKLRGQVDPSLTMTGLAMGTPHYMAPEQRSDSGAVDHRADIYSLGVMFYEMLTGHLPTGRFPYPSAERAVDARIDEVVLRAMEHDPDRRYQQASEVRSEIEIIGSTPAPAPPPADPPPLPRESRHEARGPRRRHAHSSGTGSAIKMVVAVALLGALTMGALFLMFLVVAPADKQGTAVVMPDPPLTAAQADRGLQTAVRKRSPWAMKTPLRRGANPDLVFKLDGRDTSVLIESAKIRVEMVELLLAAGAEPDGRPSPDSWVTPLCVAAGRGKTEIVRKLLVYHADAAFAGTAGLAPEGVAEERMTALEWAMSTGKTGTAGAILDHLEAAENVGLRRRAGIGVRDFELLTRVFASEEILDIGDRLVALGADVDACEDGKGAGASVLSAAILADATSGGGFTRWVLSKGADADRITHSVPPLMYAFRLGAVDAVRALCDAGADVDVKVEGGTTTMVQYARDYVEQYDNGVLCRDVMEQAGKK